MTQPASAGNSVEGLDTSTVRAPQEAHHDPLRRPHLAPVAVAALALLAGGCSSDGSIGHRLRYRLGCGQRGRRAAGGASAELCSSFASLKTNAADLVSTKVDASGTPEELQQQADDLASKADKVRDDLNTMMRESNGGPAAAVIGTLNQKADALKEKLTEDKAKAQEDLGADITAAQQEISTALEPVTAAVGKLCPSS